MNPWGFRYIILCFFIKESLRWDEPRGFKGFIGMTGFWLGVHAGVQGVRPRGSQINYPSSHIKMPKILTSYSVEELRYYERKVVTDYLNNQDDQHNYDAVVEVLSELKRRGMPVKNPNNPNIYP